MIRLEQLDSANTFAAASLFATAGREEVQFLRDFVAKGGHRIRVCYHQGIDDVVQQMLICLSGDGYVRPAKHTDKTESVLVLEGYGTYLFFDDAGKITRKIPLDHEKQFFLRVPRDIFHAIVVESDMMVVMETAPGPFVRANTIFPSWAPAEDAPAARPYLRILKASI